MVEHPTSEVEAVGLYDVEVLQYSVVRKGAKIGSGTRICSHCYVDANVVIGRDCKIKNGVLIYNGVFIENQVFVGPGVVFTNDPKPRAYRKHGEPYPRTRIMHGATIGANATILPGVSIGEFAMVGAGSVVVDDIPNGKLAVGNPAKVIGDSGE